jgi:hypothetical protein
MYDDDRWNDFTHLFNSGTLEIAARLIGYHLGLYRSRSRYDGFEVFTPPESDYDLARAKRGIWVVRAEAPLPNLPPPLLDADRRALRFPALEWLGMMLSEMPQASRKILAFMPVHVAIQAWPGTPAAAIEADCKARIATIARTHGAQVIDWRIASPITINDSNYWDALHYRLPIAQRIARELVEAALDGKASEEGDYRIVVK